MNGALTSVSSGMTLFHLTSIVRTTLNPSVVGGEVWEIPGLKCLQGQLAEVRREVGWERGDLHRPPHPVSQEAAWQLPSGRFIGWGLQFLCDISPSSKHGQQVYIL